MLSNGTNITSSTAKPPKHARLWPVSVALAILALIIIASPGSAASPQPQSAQPPQAPNATCPPDGQCFADVPTTNPFYLFINRIYEEDLVTGYPCGGPNEPCDPEGRPYYRPVNNVTRQQMAKFIDNARHTAGISIIAGSSEPLIYAFNPSYNAIRGYSNSNYGLYGGSTGGHGVHGWTSTGSAGYFDGNVQVTGNLSKGGGSFKIDDPLDPENKYLYHSFVESPDMMNVYNGNVTTDANGDATIQLPDWLSVLNRDFRYQLTTIGQHADAWIDSEIEDNHFAIKTDKPNVKVSWQVTGIRQDPYANAHRIPVEEDKPTNERGKYLHPAEWGQPESSGIDYEEQQRIQEATQSKP
jgi:hypothetical protein